MVNDRWPGRSKTERDAMLNMEMHHPSLRRVVNPAQRNQVGYPASYQLHPGMNTETLISKDDWPRRRAGFTTITCG